MFSTIIGSIICLVLGTICYLFLAVSLAGNYLAVGVLTMIYIIIVVSVIYLLKEEKNRL